MTLPDCLYQKAFWIVIPILFSLVTVIFTTIDTSIAQLEVKVLENQIQIAENNVPTLKQDLKNIDDKLDALLINSARIEQKINDISP